MGSRTTDPSVPMVDPARNRRCWCLKPPGRHGGLPGGSLRGQKRDEERREKRKMERAWGGAVPGGGCRQWRWTSGEEGGHGGASVAGWCTGCWGLWRSGLQEVDEGIRGGAGWRGEIDRIFGSGAHELIGWGSFPRREMQCGGGGRDKPSRF